MNWRGLSLLPSFHWLKRHPSAAVTVAACHRAESAVIGVRDDRRHSTGIESGIGPDAYHRRIFEVVGMTAVATGAARSGIEAAHGVIAVAVTSPTPIDMKLATVIVAVQHKGMPPAGVTSRVKYRT